MKTEKKEIEKYVEETISSLEDNELFVMIDTNAPLPILLVTSEAYDNGTEKYDENGNAAYTLKTEKETKTISEEEYYAAFEKYGHAAVAEFSYGASDSAG